MIASLIARVDYAAFNYWETYKEKQTVALKVYFLEYYMLFTSILFLARV